MSSRSPTVSNQTSLCSYTSFPPRVVCVDGNKVKKKNCYKNGDSYAGISCLFVCFFFGFALREFLQSD